MLSTMALRYFTGDQVAFFEGIDDTGSSTKFTDVTAPFSNTDTVEIEVPDQYIRPDGTFDPDEVQFTSVTVVRDGIRYEFDIDSGSKIKETSGDEIKEAGDTFFTTNHEVGPPSNGPFAGLSSGKMVFSTDSTFTTGQSTTIDRTQNTDNNNDGDTTDSSESADAQFNTGQADDPICFALGTLIDTAMGPRQVEDLRPGDLIVTRDAGLQPIAWHRTRFQSLRHREKSEHPVLINPGSLGGGQPSHSLIVSPHHRILVGGGGQQVQCFPDEVLARAKSLTGLPGIRHMMGQTTITWVHFACVRHAIVRANGCWAESLLLGKIAQRGLRRAHRMGVKAAFIGAEDAVALNGQAARPCLTVRETQRLVARRLQEG